MIMMSNIIFENIFSYYNIISYQKHVFEQRAKFKW